MKVKIKYDPYRMKTDIYIDERKICGQPHYEKFIQYIEGGMPLQSWTDPIEYDNWKGFLPELIANTQESKVSITFFGRKMDFEDFKDSINSQNNKLDHKVKLDFSPQYTISDTEMIKNIEQAYKEVTSDKFKAIIEDTNFPVTDALLKKYKKLPEDYKKANNSEFRIVFAGMYSSGKSTIINALIGKNILPTSDGTCTSKIFEIRHDKSVKFARMQCVDEKGNILIKPADYSCETLENKFSEIFPKANKHSNPANIETIEIWTNLSNLYPKDYLSSNNKFNLVLVDTPGTNSGVGNSKNNNENAKSHIEITTNIVNSENKEMVIFTSNAATDQDESIKSFLNVIDNSTEKDKNSYNQRFLFVINKADQCTFNKDETIEEKLGRVQAYYTENRKNMKAPRFFPTSALAALSVRTGLTNSTKYYSIYPLYFDIDPDNKLIKPDEHQNYYFDEYCSTSQKTKDIIKDKINEINNSNIEKKEKRAKEILWHSGIPSLEMAIKDYIERYACPLKIAGLLDTFDLIVKETQQFMSIISNSIKEKIQTIDTNTENLKNEKNKESEMKEKENKLKESKEKIEKELEIFKSNNANLNIEINKVSGDTKAIINDLDQKLRQCENAKFDSDEKAKNYIKKIYDDGSKKCQSELNELYEKYKKDVKDTQSTVTGILKTVKNSLNAYNFNFEYTVAYKEISIDILKYLNIESKTIHNPDLDYSGLNPFRHIVKPIIKLFWEDVKTRYSIEKTSLATLIDEFNKKYNEYIDSYCDTLTVKIKEIEKKINRLIIDLINSMKNTQDALKQINNNISVHFNDISKLTSQQEKLNKQQSYILSVYDTIAFSQKQKEG